ncbi:cyclic nucleotide-binding domain-containing protein [Myxococcus sp. AM001]|uniref:Crp/Fnr family transcriptional regulator n=1 Tax=Myxococcus TaxID=32 RepID=UPI0013D61618|nr:MULTISPECIES: cyclic nucleotide-binding domain-containing protein [Myxococcus]NVJ03110.1 cyclic nucleotide-binding domain-containing protein [Myxococcus sp. AM009]NVJ10478.1 cyclic nucleotide-binding domain-containing protein [Myxococcus sp. AM001]NVJ19452.1 cyclic nucleotide-binding domain-containing protein [Myxococcus sp. AM010]WIG95780.1 cyclic nucleotide-binding domain-containing protein [Myxococcus sp. SDU36]
MDADVLKKVALFEGLTQGQLARLAQIGHSRTYPAGAFLFREGETSQEMFVIAEGKVRISKSMPGIGEEALAILEPGEYFGEMAVIEDSPRSADAIAHVSCSVWVIERSRLDQLMFTDKDLAYVLLWTFVRTLSERLRETNEKLKGFFALSRF